MLDIKQVEKTMNKRGFSKISTTKDGDKIIGIYFRTMYMDGLDLVCNINLITEIFRLSWAVPESINRLETPDCSALFDDEHFNGLRSKLHMQAKILYDAICDD